GGMREQRVVEERTALLVEPSAARARIRLALFQQRLVRLRAQIELGAVVMGEALAISVVSRLPENGPGEIRELALPARRALGVFLAALFENGFSAASLACGHEIFVDVRRCVGRSGCVIVGARVDVDSDARRSVR